MKADQWRRSVDGTNEEVGGEVGEMMGTNDGSVSGVNGGVGGEIEDVGGEVGGMMGTKMTDQSVGRMEESVEKLLGSFDERVGGTD
jgi:hypothetical protein